jgi:hypothetical protein
MPVADPSLAASFVEPDWSQRGALAGTVGVCAGLWACAGGAARHAYFAADLVAAAN